MTNVTETCVDQHLGKNKIALIWEKDEPGTQEYVTYEVPRRVEGENLFYYFSI